MFALVGKSWCCQIHICKTHGGGICGCMLLWVLSGLFFICSFSSFLAVKAYLFSL
jgi:hypothetical protein